MGAPAAVLARVIGSPGSGRTSAALRMAAQSLGDEDRQLLLVDTLGHGIGRALDEGDLVRRTILKRETAAPQILAVSRHLVASGQVGCVVLDDAPGLDFGPDKDQWSRAKAHSIFAHSLSALALSHRCSVILVERGGSFAPPRAPLGFSDHYV